MNIVVLLGGTSAEREVSIPSGLAVAHALRLRGHVVSVIDIARGHVRMSEEALLLPAGVHASPPPPEGALSPLDLTRFEAIQRADLAFLALHGGAGEDGTVQTVLDQMGVRYSGSDALGSRIAMDKDLTKRLLQHAEVPTLPWLRVLPTDENSTASLGDDLFPCIVKPSRQGSSVGMTVVPDRAGIPQALEFAFRYDSEVIVERFARGRELTVGILNSHALPPVEIRPKKGLYDFEAKYTPGMTEYLCPAPLSPAETSQLQALAVKAFQALRLSSYARIDFILFENSFYCLEANSLPGMTSTSLLPKAAAAAGISFPDLCEQIALSSSGTPSAR